MQIRQRESDLVLVGVNLDPPVDEVLRESVELAIALGANLHIVHVASPEPDFVGYDVGPESVRKAVADSLRDEHRALKVAKEYAEAKGLYCTSRTLQGPTAEKLLLEASKVGAHYLVVGTSKSRTVTGRALMGSTSKLVVRSSKIPVVVVPPKGG